MTADLRVVTDVAEVLSVTDVAARLKCSKRTVERLLASGALTYTRVASRRRIPVGALRAYIDSHTV